MSDFNKVFKERYKKLNSFQKEAVDTIEGPVMVIAGPGTGKTTVLVMRIASIMANTDTDPENVLALTYTESGVISMRKALSEIVGPDAHKVKINTFHGFCNGLINDFPEEFPEIIGARHIPESEQISYIESILSSNNFSVLTPTGDPLYYVYSVLESIHSLKREGADPETFLKEVLKEEEEFYKRDDIYNSKGKNKGLMKGDALKKVKSFEKNKEFAKIFELYRDHLKREHCYDYEDMILEVVKKMKKNKELLTIVQEENHYVLADEHQDANSAQNQVIKELVSFHERPNIFIVGDEKQAIFRFQGASLNNFMYFKELYPDIKVIYLVDNYRSQQTVLNAAQKLIESGDSFDKNVHKPLKAVSGRKERSLLLKETRSVLEESFFVAESVADLIKKGVYPNEIAVVYRNHKDATPFVRAIEKIGVPYLMRSDKNLFEDSNIRSVIDLMGVVCDPIDNEMAFKVLHSGIFEVDSIDVLKVNRYAQNRRIFISDVLESNDSIKSSGVLKPESLVKAYSSLKKWNRRSFDVDITALLEEMVYESGIIDNVLTSPQSAVSLNRMRDFFKEADRFTKEGDRPSLFSFTQHLKTMEAYKLSLKGSELDFERRVEFMTAHSSKGREFDYVFIVNAIDKKWGNVQKRNKFRFPVKFSGSFNIGDNEDERRLFYVSLTRAREKAVLTFSKFREDGKEQLPSIFVNDIDEPGILNVDRDELSKKKLEKIKPEQLYGPVISKGPSIVDRDYIIKMFLDKSLSITAINAYLECPWKFFYNNLMRFPGTYSLNQKFGTAVHESLKSFFDIYQTEGDPGKEFLVASFKEALSRQILSKNDEEILSQKGERALVGYHENYSGVWKMDILNEKSIDDVSLKIDLLPKPLTLTGKIDKIEGGSNYTVIDYKTGKPKSRNVIEGKTKSSEGNIKRQLVFYKLLVDSSLEIDGSVSEGVIDFIEPNERGYYKKEAFSISEEEVSAIKDMITEMAKDVYSLAFWDRKCEKEDCVYCSMREKLVSKK